MTIGGHLLSRSARPSRRLLQPLFPRELLLLLVFSTRLSLGPGPGLSLEPGLGPNRRLRRGNSQGGAAEASAPVHEAESQEAGGPEADVPAWAERPLAARKQGRRRRRHGRPAARWPGRRRWEGRRLRRGRVLHVHRHVALVPVGEAPAAISKPRRGTV